MRTATNRTSSPQRSGTPSSEAALKRSTRSWRSKGSPGASATATEAPAVMMREISDGPPSHWRYCTSCAPPIVPSPMSPSWETSVRWT